MRKGGIREINSFIAVPDNQAGPSNKNIVSKNKPKIVNSSSTSTSSKIILDKKKNNTQINNKMMTEGVNKTKVTPAQPSIMSNNNPTASITTKFKETSSSQAINSNQSKKISRNTLFMKSSTTCTPSKPNQNRKKLEKSSNLKDESKLFQIEKDQYSSRETPSVETETRSKSENENTAYKTDTEIQDYDYEDDFEDYESTFESYSESSDSSASDQSREEITDLNVKKVFVEEEKKMDSGSYDLMLHKRSQIGGSLQLDSIKEALQKENNFYRQKNSSSEILSDLQTNPLPLSETRDKWIVDPSSEISIDNIKNFQNMVQKHKNKKVADMIKVRAEKFFQMITLDEMNYVFYNVQPISYDLFMRSHFRNNVKQAFTQTNENNLSLKIQTDEILKNHKWTQFPVKISKELLRDYDMNYYSQIITGSGDDSSDKIIGSNFDSKILSSCTGQKLNNFMRIFGEEMIAVLEENLQNSGQVYEKIDEHKESSHFSQLLYRINYLKMKWFVNQPILSFKYNNNDSSRFLTIHQVTDKSRREDMNGFSFIGLWSIHHPRRPTVILKSFAQITCASFVSTDSSFVVAGHDDGSVCVWNLRDRREHHTKSFDPDEVPFLSPSFITAQVMGNKNHSTKVLHIDGVKMKPEKYTHSLKNERKPQMIYSLDEENILRVWTLLENKGRIYDLGSAPWSKTKFFLNQILDINQLKTKIPFQSTVIALLSEHHVLIGTNIALVIGCKLIDRRLFKYSPQASWEQTDNTSISVTNIELCPENNQLFLVLHNNAELFLFNIKYSVPISRFHCDPHHNLGSFINVQWLSNEENCIFIFKQPTKFEIRRLVTDEFILEKQETFNGNIRTALISSSQPFRKQPIHLVLLSDDEIQIFKLL